LDGLDACVIELNYNYGFEMLVTEVTYCPQFCFVLGQVIMCSRYKPAASTAGVMRLVDLGGS